MNIQLPHMPQRTDKRREQGLTMVMDKGLSLRQVEGFIESSGEFTDLVKLGFGTSAITNKLAEKIKLYHEADIKVYPGGTLFEVFAIRDKVEEFLKFVGKYKMDMIEVSDGSMHIGHEDKLGYIQEMARYATVISEVGSKQRGIVIPDRTWVQMMESELEAGSWKVIAEARESGTIGIYNSDGSANLQLINTISEHVHPDNVLWEAPTGKQQVFFIKLQGCNVNLGNIAPDGVIPLECLRLGLRGDTFFQFLPDEYKKYQQSPDDYD